MIKQRKVATKKQNRSVHSRRGPMTARVVTKAVKSKRTPKKKLGKIVGKAPKPNREEGVVRGVANKMLAVQI